MDELMMEWLYDELDPSRSARVAEHVGGCARCSAEMSALRGTREAFRDLSDVEPPASITAILLHEAASAVAPSRAAVSSLWARLGAMLRPLALHPAATALATLILVAGVAGALYMRRGREMVRSGADVPASDAVSSVEAPRPPQTAEEKAPSPPAAPEASDRLDEPQARIAHAGKDDGYKAEVLDSEAQAALEKAQDDGDVGGRNANERERDKKGAAAKSSARGGGKAGDEPRVPAPARSRKQAVQAPAKEDRRVTAPVETGAAVGAGPRPADPEPETVVPTGGAASAAASTPAAQAPLRGEASGELEGAEKPLSRQEQSWLASQEVKLRELVKRKQCPEAAVVANDILDRNPAYYDRRLRASKQVEPCLSHVGIELRRRASLRARAPATTKASAGTVQKARAAPEKDEAAREKSRQ